MRLNLGIDIKRVIGTPYKLVLRNKDIIGVFDHGIYVCQKDASDGARDIINKFKHADTLLERLEAD